MGVHKHDARTKTDRLIAAVEALTAELRSARSRRVYAVIVKDYEDCIYCAGMFASKEAAEKERLRHGSAEVFDRVVDGEIDEPSIAANGVDIDQIIHDVVINDARRRGPISTAIKS